MKKIGILKAMRLCGAYEKMNAEERCSLQARRLKELVEYARKNSPFYQRLYRDVPESFDLSDLPPTDKKTLMANWNGWVCDRELTLEQVEQFMADKRNIGGKLNGKYLVFTTSGSTGVPLTAKTERRCLKPQRCAWRSTWHRRESGMWRFPCRKICRSRIRTAASSNTLSTCSGIFEIIFRGTV